MSLFHAHLSTAVKLVESYRHEIPFSTYIKDFFSANKKYGSRDRKRISALCYNYFRMGKNVSGKHTQEQILLATFLCEQEPCEMMEKLKPVWNKKITLSIQKKIAFVQQEFSLTDIFELKEFLSPQIDFENFCKSHLIQPDVFIRLRPKNIIGTKKKLEKCKLSFRRLDDDCIAFTNSVKINDYFIIDKEVVIQDYNSQKVLDYFIPQNAGFKTPLTSVWDCCAASGGKSILMYDIFNQRIDLTISDVRPNIILNLHKRFDIAGIKTYNYFIADLLEEQNNYPLKQQQVIICDAPCSGSGTWGRTPEMLTHFDVAKISTYQTMQQKIVSNVIPYLQNEGVFVYITCSVFKKENEDVVQYIQDNTGLKLLSQKLLTGYENKADTMFVAVFKKM